MKLKQSVFLMSGNSRLKRVRCVRLDKGGIGDTLCALRAACGARLPFIGPPNQRDWTNIFVDEFPLNENELPMFDLHLSDYRRVLDQNVISRGQFFAAQCRAVPISPEEKPFEPGLINKLAMYAGCVVIAPFAAHGPEQGSENRSWPLERWLEVNKLLIDAGFVTLILDEYEERCLPFLSEDQPLNEPGGKYSYRCKLFCGKPPVEVAAVLRMANLFVGNDSGMMHLAGTLGVRGVAIIAECSDINIAGDYESLVSLGERHSDFIKIQPADVVSKLIEIQRNNQGGFPVEDFEKIILPMDSWRVNAWLSIYSALWHLIRELNPQTIVEIGTRAGYSAQTFLWASDTVKVKGIDANIAEHGGFVGAMNHALAVLPPDRFELTIANSHELQELPECELVYVDGDHSRSGALQDLHLALTAKPKWILVDDITNCWDTVKPACDEFIAETGWEYEYIPSMSGHYLLTRPKAAASQE